METNESKNISDKEFLKTFIDDQIKHCEEGANYNKTRSREEWFEESAERWLIEFSYRYAYWMDLRFLIDYGETVAIDYGNDKTLRNTIDDIVTKVLIPYLTFNEILIKQCINDIAQFKSPNPPMRIAVQLPLPAEGKTIDLEQLQKEPLKQDVALWIKEAQLKKKALLEQRKEYLRVLYLLQEDYGCGVTYNPIDFDMAA